MMVAHTLLEERSVLPNDQPFVHVEDGRALAQAIVDTIREPLLVLDQDSYETMRGRRAGNIRLRIAFLS
jgi:hypothetical protein